MSVTTDHPPLRAVPFRAPTARLALKPLSPSPGHVELDGAWWPRSRDMTHELAALADVLDPLWGRITRIAVNPRYWSIIPHKIFVNGHVVKVGWFTSEQDPHKIRLLSYTAGRWDLLVIPPETSAPSAARLMAAASDYDGPPLTASALIAADEAGHAVSAADQPLDPDETWEYEGGASAVSVAVPEQTGPSSQTSRLIVGM
ncbi:DUF5994 family protein [Streptomyces sp. NEAU-YJ-81]|uniref:DUF5994 family protein n=1 Tax=Streptomyces sp. NEAU-YJ-81 TaxID=2820288 RepID=UPI001ABC93B7|nr:DUF5994 family protein [Streptomyces sp. NEAU-YJ-81]MBO3678666.1 hypothetical protein [Streptomyces sp. NEAU-YJ-81]